MTDTNPPKERETDNSGDERRRQLMRSLDVTREHEIRDATLELLHRFANLQSARPGETDAQACMRGFQNSWRIDDVRSIMIAALQS